jgi:single-stranded DNA-binding protein
MQLALITGKMFRNAEVKISKSGKEYGTITLQTTDKGASVFWRVTAFSENVISEFKHLKNGDALSIQGALDLSVFEKDGQWQIGRSLRADRVLSLRKIS